MDFQSQYTMVPSAEVCVIGSGSLALFTGWTLEQKLGQKIPIYTNREAQIRGISRVCIGLSAYPYKPLCCSVSDLLATRMKLYVICCGPMQSVRIALRIRLLHPASFIIILGSFSFFKDFMLLAKDRLTLYAYPLVSVERSASLVSATNHLSVSIYAGSLGSSIWDIVSHFCGPRDISIANESEVAARAILTYSLYSYMLYSGSLDHVFVRKKLVDSCSSTAYGLATVFKIGVNSFASSGPGCSLEDVLVDVFESFASNLFASNSHAFNFIHLLANRNKLSRFMEGSGCKRIS